ncbi:response regulator transcription factor [Achromobacter aloeverae]|uniref:Alkaline phosphatase n=1 Tax=Achromobacter aloeverae TaxID=1750518 RepID=A0A4V1MS38_9BURK|nr:response regulator [Achromobacter aloeverae]RXN88130.1 alkaline phosphatase [Achromobacter aloeverae]
MAKIMVVDDEATLASVVRDALGNAGHRVYMETDGLTALSRMIELKPDLVVSDVMMPGMGGASLLVAMRDNAYLHDVPCIVMSGLSEDVVSDACGAHYSAFLAKPFDLRDLVAAVDRVLDGAA